MTIKTPPPALRGIVDAVTNKRNVTLYKESN